MIERSALLDSIKYKVSFACAEHFSDEELTPVGMYEVTHAIEVALQELQVDGRLGKGDVIPLLEVDGNRMNITFAANPGTPVWKDLTAVGFKLVNINE